MSNVKPLSAAPGYAQALSAARLRLQHVSPEIWDDIEDALGRAMKGHFNPGLDELDCNLLEDLVVLHRQREAVQGFAWVESEARALIEGAKARGYHVAIEPRPRQPLAMRNYELQVTVWPAR
jgi:hypothetical protein